MADEPHTELYKDVNALRHPKQEPEDPDAALHEKLKEHSIFTAIVRSKVQEIATLGVIVLNALFIGYDTDYSARWSRPEGLYNQGSRWGFPFMENFFCIYFTLEVLIRFMAYKVKSDGMWDPWFVFDSTLVLIMVLETWVLEVVGSSKLPIDMDMLRLLRLLRITRMGKLMRFFPELAIIVKGMVAAVRSVGCTAILLILVMYVFSIIFTDAYHQGLVDDADVPGDTTAYFFGSMGKSMRHLFIFGTILDDITRCCNTIRGGEKVQIMMTAFIVFVLVSSFTMLNMLIGILCEVVTATSDGERSRATEEHIRSSIANLFEKMDEDQNGTICRKEFLMMKDDREVCEALEDLDVEAKHFDMYADLMFSPPEEGAEAPVMNLDSTINMIMRLRPGSKVSALDFASFQQGVFKNHSAIKQQINRIEKMVSKVVKYDPEEDQEARQEGENRESTGMGDEEISMLQLEQFTNEQILGELQKRVGMDVSLPGCLDPSLGTEKMVEAFETLCVPQPETDGEAWSKTSYTC